MRKHKEMKLLVLSSTNIDVLPKPGSMTVIFYELHIGSIWPLRLNEALEGAQQSRFPCFNLAYIVNISIFESRASWFKKRKKKKQTKKTTQSHCQVHHKAFFESTGL